MGAPCIVVAAPASGAGKTVVTLGLARALRRRGWKVGTFKIGPDYIDPAFLAAASGRSCPNLDSWAMRFETLVSVLDEASRGADVVIGEGVMGLFDGAPDGTGSTADIAAIFDLPVVLTVDARRMGASIAALVEGFKNFREDVEIAALLLNGVGSEAHERMLRDACAARFSVPVLGVLPRIAALELPSRHLGLVQATEHRALEACLDAAADLVDARVDVDGLVGLARRPSVAAIGSGARPLAALGQRIAVARDVAFAFAYDSVLSGWRRLGAEVSFFSPLADEAPATDADAVFLPGGYPELHALRLAASHRFLEGLARARDRGAAIYGECGGYMVLGEALIDRDGAGHRMAGLLPIVTSFAEPKLHLGYREVVTLGPSPLGRPHGRFRGHEFHYASEIVRGGEALFLVRDARGNALGEAGCRQGNVAGSFVHLIDRQPAVAAVT